MKRKLSFSVILLIILGFTWGCEKTTEPDITPPKVSILFPTDGATVRDSVIIKSTVADNDGISKVEFYVDGEFLASVKNEPFEVIWNTKQTTNGEHNLQCKAIDNSNNETLSNIVKVLVVNYLFKATFTNDWLPNWSGQAIIFLSDNDGNILAEKVWTGNDGFEMYLNDGIRTYPITINVTTMKRNPVIVELYITTYMNIPVGSSWTWKGGPSTNFSNSFSVDFRFQNVPEHEKYRMSSKWLSSSGSDIRLSDNYDFFESPTDFYIKLNTTNNGVKYYWVNDVVSGIRQVDLSNMKSASSHTINLPGTAGYWLSLNGIVNPGHRYKESYYLDHNQSYSDNSITVYYPESFFTDFKTKIYYYDDPTGKGYWSQTTYGKIPNQFTKIDADFDYVNTSRDNYEISASGDYTQTASQWISRDYNYYWYIYGGKGVTKYKLPIFPSSAFQLFYFLDRSSFNLWEAGLQYYPELSSYDDVLSKLFNSPEYFYDVVNEVRKYTRYSTKGMENKIFTEEFHQEQHYNY